MIIFDFKIDERALKEDLETDLGLADAAALQETYFEMPVRLRINNIDLLERPGSKNPWLALPLLDLISVVKEEVQQLKGNKESSPYLPGGWRLKFTLRNSKVTILSYVNGDSAEIEYDELMEAFSLFSDKVKSFLQTRAPGLKANPYWGKFI